jgi:hydrogenase-4 component F
MLYLVLLLMVFIGMGSTVLAVVLGAPSSTPTTSYRDTPQTVLPIVILFLLVLCLGVYIPPPLDEMLRAAAAYLERKAP